MENIEEYREVIIKAAPSLADSFEELYSEASRTLSPLGLKEWLEGGRAMAALGRGERPVVEYLYAAPQVARECGEDLLRDLSSAGLQLASMTSGEVIALLYSSMPIAARRLGDPDLMRAYLQLVHRLSARAPRGLRPMFTVIEELLSKLTLSGLRRWVDFGAEAYRRDLVGQAKYFGLESEDSRSVLKKERRGTQFIDSQRKLNFYLRAFWGRDFFLRPVAADYLGFRPYIERRMVFLPDAVDSIGKINGLQFYRAMAAHMAAHIAYTFDTLEQQELTPAQLFMIGFFEDARVEYAASYDFPGIEKIWQTLLPDSSIGSERDRSNPHPTLPLLERTARALLVSGESTADSEIDALVDEFYDGIDENRLSSRFSYHLGLKLFHLLAVRKDVPALRLLEQLQLPWRDDNRYIWQSDEIMQSVAQAAAPEREKQVRRRVSLMEFINEIDNELADENAQEIWTLDGTLYDDDGLTFNEKEGKEPVSLPYYYPEWDYQLLLHRPDWTTVYETRQSRGDPEKIEEILRHYRPVSSRIRRIIDRLRPEGVKRIRRIEDGDELDLNAAVDAAVALRAGLNPDMRITMRSQLNARDISVLLLLDLSKSTEELVRGSDKSVLELTREASVLLATAIDGIGDPFAIHGFASDGRHNVHYYLVKDFEQRFDREPRARLAGLEGGYSTRMGAAMRHAAHHLLHRSSKRKLLLVLTDGEPADIDERDPQYLRSDTKRAVDELRSRGIDSYCLTLDPEADRYVERIFGAGRYTIIDHVERLPERLPTLFATLTR